MHGNEICHAYYRCRPVMMSSMVNYTSNVQRSVNGVFELRHALWPIAIAAGGYTMPSKDKVNVQTPLKSTPLFFHPPFPHSTHASKTV